jgi:phosphoribosyl-ATP pyrophosphohydrolase/phosphoribosyl-AMP cyclohydrolase
MPILKELCSFTFKLEMNKIVLKSWWEAVEVVIEGLTIKMICFERKDLLFHYLILLQAKGFDLEDVVKVLKSRQK